MADKVYQIGDKLPTKIVMVGGVEVEKIKAPDEAHVNDPAYVQRRVERAEKHRPAHVK
jgi:hypothetical protein